MRIFLLLLLAVFQVSMTTYLLENPDFYQLDAYTWESREFRDMNLGEWISDQYPMDVDALTTWMISEEYDLSTVTEKSASKLMDWMQEAERIRLRRPVEYQKLRGAYDTIFRDLRYFPIPESSDPETPSVVYENGWMDARTYGGDRGHEGCDIMGEERPRGFYPVVSISDGVVEKVGWLEQGGWRLGIRTPSGLYLYYAHLYGYSRDWQEGDPVKAGELLGFMGDSGYSAVEGTVGNFAVHLHLGIYLRTDHYEELSVNPYWILRYLEKKKLIYKY